MTVGTTMDVKATISAVCEWHSHAKLEAVAWPCFTDSLTFEFFRNGMLVGQVLRVTDDGYVNAFGVTRSLQGTGLGHAMLDFIFQKTGLQQLTLHSSANAFYHKVGGRRHGNMFTLDKANFKPSTWKFTEIDTDRSQDYHDTVKRPKFDMWPSIN